MTTLGLIDHKPSASGRIRADSDQAGSGNRESKLIDSLNSASVGRRLFRE